VAAGAQQPGTRIAISNVGGDKSFADDLNKERGIVSGRAALLLRFTEIHPLFPDLSRPRGNLLSASLELLLSGFGTIPPSAKVLGGLQDSREKLEGEGGGRQVARRSRMESLLMTPPRRGS
jgi:hypothetical protein